MDIPITKPNYNFENKRVHIMGLGWLGLPLAISLKNSGAQVSGSVTSAQKQKILQTNAIDTDIFNLYEPLSTQKTTCDKPLESRFFDASLVLNIPPGRKNFDKEIFVSKVISLIDYAMKSGLQKLVFISTTSVFGELCGCVDNNTATQPKTESGKAHQAIEAHLARYYINRSTILRPAGLIGPNSTTIFNAEVFAHKNRHPIYTLCDKIDIPNAYDPVNLIHQTDVIQAIMTMLLNKNMRHAFNLSALAHPTRQAYYQWCAKHLDLPIPTFMTDTKKRPLGKLIDARQSFTELGFSPQYASPYEML